MSPGTHLPAVDGDDASSGPGSGTATPTLLAADNAAGGVALQPHRRGRSQQRSPYSHDPERFAHALARIFLEVEVGRRPLRQLGPVLAPALQARLAVAARRPGPGPTLDAVLAVRSSRPHPNACDAAVVVRRGERVGVLVVRLERHNDAWRVVELARPEDRAPVVTT